MKFLLNLVTRQITPFYLTESENPNEFLGKDTTFISNAQVAELSKANTIAERDAIIKRIVTERFMNTDVHETMSEAEQNYVRKALNEGMEAKAKLESMGQHSELEEEPELKASVKVEAVTGLLTREQVMRLSQAKLVEYCRNVLKWDDVDDKDPSSILKTRILEAEGFKK